MARASITALRQMVRQTLLADAALRDLLGADGNVLTAHVQDATAETVKMPLVIIELSSGNARWHGYVQSQVCEVYTYSKASGDLASQIYDRVFDILRHERMIQGGVVDPAAAVMFEVQRPSDGYNKDVRAWFCRGRWQINAA